ncbi:MAG: DPP IV N-terminal domain-containing protein, partial [Planctomycetota bacterium]
MKPRFETPRGPAAFRQSHRRASDLCRSTVTDELHCRSPLPNRRATSLRSSNTRRYRSSRFAINRNSRFAATTIWCGAFLMAAVSLCSANAWSQDANTWSQDANAWSQDRGGAKAETAKENEIPPLSLSSLYRPDARHRYASTLPPLSWMETAEDEFVLVRRAEDQWEILDPQSGETSEWTFPELLTEAVLGEDLFFEDSAASIKLPSSPVAKDASAKETSADGTDDASAEDAEQDREAAKRRRAGRLVNRYLRGMTSTFRPTLWTFGKRLLLVRPDRLRKINDDADDDVASAGVFDVLAMDASAFRDAALSPDGRRLGYSRNGDLYVMDTQNGAVTRLTDDGLETLLDGRLDWTYQEEIFGRGNFKAFWFSPDGKQVAALRIDTSSVPEYFLAHSRDPRGAGPVVRYPKAGDPIPHATLLIYDIDSGTSRAFHQSTPQAQRIITGVWWHPHSGDLLYTVSDRVQSWRELHRVVAGQPASQLVLREESPAWVEPPESPLFFADGSFLWRSEVATGKGRVFHVARDGRSVMPISPVNFHVRSMAMDADAKFVLVTGDASIIGNGQHVYRIALASGDGESATPPGELGEMVQLTRGDGWHAPSFRPDGGALVDSHSSVDMPTRRSWISCPADTRSFEIDAV